MDEKKIAYGNGNKQFSGTSGSQSDKPAAEGGDLNVRTIETNRVTQIQSSISEAYLPRHY
jgi:hypothetical protein